MTLPIIQNLIAELGLQMDATFVPRSKTPNGAATKLHEMQINWRVRVYRGKASVATPYGEGIGHLPKSIRPRNLSRVTVYECDAITAALETGTYFTTRSTAAGAMLPPPKIEDVLYALVMDSSALQNTGFEDWCSDYGAEPDSRQAERAYRACVETGLALLRMVGSDNLERLRNAYQDY